MAHKPGQAIKYIVTSKRHRLLSMVVAVFLLSTALIFPTRANAQLVKDVTFAPPTIVGGQSTAGSINLLAPWDITIIETATLTSDNSAVIVPGTLNLTANALSFPFTVTTNAVTSTQVAHITVNLAGTISVGTVTVVPSGLTVFSLSPAQCAGGTAITVNVALSVAAPTGGKIITLVTASSLAFPLPASVAIPAGSSSASITVPTSTVNNETPVTCTASDGTVTLTSVLTLEPTSLRVTAIYMPNTIKLQWDAAASGSFVLKRDGSVISTQANSNSSFLDVFTFNTGEAYRYDLYDSNSPSQPIASEIVTLYRDLSTSNQTVDNRLDLRYSVPTLLNHFYGSTIYRGGLYVGYANDPSRVARSFASFTLSSATADTYRAGTAALYYLGSYTVNNANSTVNIGCQAIFSTGVANIVWSTAPSIVPSNAPYSTSITYTPASPNPQWLNFAMNNEIKAALGNPITLALAAKDETSVGWAYLAKQEYGSGVGPAILHAHCQPVAFGINMTPNPVTPSSTSGSDVVTAKLFMNGIGPPDSASVAISCNHPELVTNLPSSVTVTGLLKTFTFKAKAVTQATTITFTIEYDRTSTDKDIVTYNLIVNPATSGGGTGGGGTGGGGTGGGTGGNSGG